MKVFLSWSGSKSKQIASVFKDWLPSVIQSIEPFISSEDIEIGSRWSNEIAQELQETSFGIIFLTKDNLNAPWLNFEAGALSKALNRSYVAPFLYDIKPSDLTDSPIAQFQTTSRSKEDVYRLMETINNANEENKLPEERLKSAFDTWYPNLESSLEAIMKNQTEHNESSKKQTKIKQADYDILEDILESSINTQRLLGNTDMKLYKNIEDLQEQIERLEMSIERNSFDELRRRRSNRIDVLFINDFLRRDEMNKSFQYRFPIVIGLIKEDFPWIYDAGREFIDTLKKSRGNNQAILSAHESFERILELSSQPIYMETFINSEIDMLSIMKLMNLLADYTRGVVDEYIYNPDFML